MEWIEKTLGELGDIVGGATPSTKHEEYYGGDIAWITPKDLSLFKGRYISCGERSITEAGLASCSAQMMPSNTVLFTSRAPIGYVAIARQSVCTNQGFKSVVPHECVDSLFLYYLLKFNKERIEAMGSGTTFKEVSGKTMKAVQVRIPCKIEDQKKIASILDSIDSKIENNAKINDNLQQQARAMYKEWFIDFGSTSGTTPATWKHGKLKDVLQLHKRAIKSGANTTLPYLPIDTIPMQSFGVTEFRPNDEAKSSLITFQKDDIIVGAMRVYFHRVVLAPCDGITRTTCFTLSPYNSKYLSYALLTCDLDSSIDHAQNTSKGSTMPYAVWDGGMGEIEIIIPPIDVAEEFNNSVLPMLRQIQRNCEEIQILGSLRDTLLPKLMSGEIDVSDLDL